MKKVRTLLYTISLLTGGFAAYLSFEVNEIRFTGYSPISKFPVAAGVDSAKDGGAAGFAILSGLALVAASITYLKKD